MLVTFEEDYNKEIPNALEKCQFIEEKLRDCIIKAAEVARVRSSQDFPFKSIPKDISRCTMGRLIGIFEKINDKTELLNVDSKFIGSLKIIKEDRNKVAHNSQLFTLGELQDKEYMMKETLNMKDITERASAIHYKLLDIRDNLIKTLHMEK
jgi:hypothetical protein